MRNLRVCISKSEGICPLKFCHEKFGCFSASTNLLKTISLEILKSGKPICTDNRYIKEYCRNCGFEEGNPIFFDSNFEERVSGRNLLVIGDVHGDLDELLTLLDKFHDNEYMIFLGDIVGHGPRSADTARYVFKFVNEGKAELVIGNHEILFLEAMRGKRIRSPGTEKAIKEFSLMHDNERKMFHDMFTCLLNMSSFSLHLEKMHFAHGAWWPGCSNRDCIHGRNIMAGGKYTSIYTWLNRFPISHYLFLGHDPVMGGNMIGNGLGGGVIFLDTGCGKGGYLSALRIEMKGNKPENMEMVSTY